MAEKLKRFFDESLVRSIAGDLRRAHSSFRQRAFVAACTRKLGRLELTARAWHVADVMHDFLPRRFAAAAQILVSSLGPELTKRFSSESSIRAAKMHEEMAACLRSEKSFADCQTQMHQRCMSTIGEKGRPMMRLRHAASDA